RGFQLDGVDDAVTFTSGFTGNTSHTISAWVDVLAPLQGFSSVMTVGNSSGGQSRFLHTNYPNVAFGFYGNDHQPSDTDIDGDGMKLVHWVFTGAGTAGTSLLYIDGVQVASATHDGTINTQGTGGHIGTAPMQWGPG